MAVTFQVCPQVLVSDWNGMSELGARPTYEVKASETSF